MMNTNLKNLNTTILIALVLVAFPAAGNASIQIKGATFNPKYTVGETELDLLGLGKKSVLFMDAFVAGLYLNEEDQNQDPLTNVAKHLEVEYFVKIPAKKLNKYTVDHMKLNTTKAEFNELDEKIDDMSQYFVDLKPGDRFALTYIPNVGTKFSHNGELIGVIEGENFARALFAVWFGERPFDRKLKNQILDGIDNNAEEEVALLKVDD